MRRRALCLWESRGSASLAGEKLNDAKLKPAMRRPAHRRQGWMLLGLSGLMLVHHLAALGPQRPSIDVPGTGLEIHAQRYVVILNVDTRCLALAERARQWRSKAMPRCRKLRDPRAGLVFGLWVGWCAFFLDWSASPQSVFFPIPTRSLSELWRSGQRHEHALEGQCIRSSDGKINTHEHASICQAGVGWVHGCPSPMRRLVLHGDHSHMQNRRGHR